MTMIHRLGPRSAQRQASVYQGNARLGGSKRSCQPRRAAGSVRHRGMVILRGPGAAPRAVHTLSAVSPGVSAPPSPPPTPGRRRPSRRASDVYEGVHGSTFWKNRLFILH